MKKGKGNAPRRQKSSGSSRRGIRTGTVPREFMHFAPQALTLLRGWGLDIEESRRFIALAYQLRRAYYFIFRHLVWRIQCMQQLRQDLWQNVFTHDILMYNQYLWDRMENFSTLVFGEPGTDKGDRCPGHGALGLYTL